MSSAEGARDRGSLVVISDLHLAAGRHDPFVADRELVAFLDQLAVRAALAEHPIRLVLLGDTFDFSLVEVAGRRLDPTAAGALARLERIADAHPAVLATLGRVAAAGVTLHLVPGNHDLELLFDPVIERVRTLLTPAGGAVELHPWILRFPGLAYLEHGQQHHDLNRVTRLVDDLAAGSEIPPPAGTVYGEALLAVAESLGADLDVVELSARSLARAARRRPGRAPQAVRPALRALRDLAACELEARRAERPRAAATRAAGAARHAAELGLPAELVARLERVSASVPSAALRRVLTRDAEPYMVRAARGVDEVLAQAGQSVPFYVFAHTHVPDDRPLGVEPGAARYLNPGTWSRLRLPQARRSCFVEIGVSDGVPTARLARWG